jgi:hypothetical protein
MGTWEHESMKTFPPEAVEFGIWNLELKKISWRSDLLKGGLPKRSDL